jgi:hypothetical protein
MQLNHLRSWVSGASWSVVYCGNTSALADPSLFHVIEVTIATPGKAQLT